MAVETRHLTAKGNEEEEEDKGLAKHEKILSLRDHEDLLYVQYVRHKGRQGAKLKLMHTYVVNTYKVVQI
jgi:hypothetical protein